MMSPTILIRCPDFPMELYEKTQEHEKPSDVLDLVDNVKNRMGTPDQYDGLMFSHNTSSIHGGPKQCLYKCFQP